MLGLFVLFLLLRLPGIHLPYHQDEWKNVSASASIEDAGKFFAHPPFQQVFFVAEHKIFGENGMRIPPVLFALGAAILLYLIVRERAGKSAGVWSVFLFSLCYYNILGSLVPDVDGAVMPFFFLLALYAYGRFVATAGLHDSHITSMKLSPVAWRWFLLLIVALLAGFLVKLSFILVVGTIGLEYLWSHRTYLGLTKGSGVGRSVSMKRLGFVVLASVGFGIVYILILLVTEKVYPAFSISFMLGHAQQFSDAPGRNYVQIVVQTMKAIYYLSPLVVLLPFLVNKEIFKKTRDFWIYLIGGLLFYLVVVDFSAGALDKYLMFVIVPLCAIGGMVVAQIFSEPGRSKKVSVILGIILVAVLVALNFLPHTVVPLYPKTEWFSRILHGHWNVLTPFNGGSGPLGFYVSFLFIAFSYLVSIICVAAALIRKKWKVSALVILLLVGCVYNLVFTEEYIHGSLNGSASAALAESVAYISSHPSITQVMTYNDIGAQKLENLGVYAGRFYAAPQFEEGHKTKFAEYKGEYLVIAIPPLYNGFYSVFFSKCDTLFETRSGTIVARVYSCKQALQ